MAGAAHDRCIDRKHIEDSLLDPRIDPFQIDKRKISKTTALCFGQLYGLPGDMMSFASWDVCLPHEPVSKVRSRCKAAFGEGTHPIRPECEGFNHAGHRRE